VKLKPLGDRLIVRAIDRDETSAGGIVLPDTAKERPQRGQVVAVGDGRFDGDGERRIPVDVAEGDTVLYEQDGGTEIEVEGEDLLVLREADVLAAVPRGRRHLASSTKAALAREIAELREGLAGDLARLKQLSS
jgi:chaperonin GroES